MNSVQMHLALTHVPVVLSLVGLLMLAVASFIKNPILTKTSYVVLVVAGLSAIPVFLTGEGAEEAIENLPGISEAVNERHEEMAQLAIITIAVAGLAAMAALFAFNRQAIARVLKGVVLALALIAGGFMAQTAHLGGQIRHTEIRSCATVQNNPDNGGEQEGNAGEKKEDDD